MSVLDGIAAARRERIALMERIDPVPEPPPAPAPARFLAAVRRPPGENARLIAEIKRAAPSAGVLRPRLDAAQAAAAYARGGAAAVSAVTEEAHFGGSIELFRAARAAAGVPVLWKDFVVSDYQLRLARREGADAVLLIAALAGRDLGALVARCLALGLEPLVEVHDVNEGAAAAEAGARAIGVNNRDLSTLAVDLSTTERVAAELPRDRVLVAESGVRTPADFRRLAEAGADAVLVGSSLMRQSDLESAARRLLSGEET